MPSCDTQHCSRQALFRFGVCVLCWRHFCGDHLKDNQTHDCGIVSKAERASRMRYNQRLADDNLIGLIDVPKLAAEAATLRPGYDCSGPDEPLGATDSPLVGQGSNFHLPLTFDDGVKWMARIRKKTWEGPPVEALRINMASEVITLKAMREKGLSVPDAWFRPAGSQLSPNLIYFFEEFVPGHPHLVRHDSSPIPLTSSDLGHINSTADWFISLGKLSFSSFGSLSSDPTGQPVVGPWIRVFVEQEVEPYFTGPFLTAKAMYLAILDRMLEQTVHGDRYPPVRELEGYLVLMQVKSLVQGCKEMDEEIGYIKHGDDKGDHYMVDDGQKILSVIDWEWSFITCKSDAFAASFALTDRSFLKAGDNTLSLREQALARVYDQLDRPDLAKCVREGKKFQRLYEFLRFERDLVPKSINAMRRAFQGIADGEMEGEPQTKEEWITAALEKFKGDEGLAVVYARHEIRLGGLVLAMSKVNL